MYRVSHLVNLQDNYFTMDEPKSFDILGAKIECLIESSPLQIQIVIDYVYVIDLYFRQINQKSLILHVFWRDGIKLYFIWHEIITLMSTPLYFLDRFVKRVNTVVVSNRYIYMSRGCCVWLKLDTGWPNNSDLNLQDGSNIV